MKPSSAAVPQKRPDLWAFPGPGRRHSSPAGEQVLRTLDRRLDRLRQGPRPGAARLAACAIVLSVAIVLSGPFSAPAHAADDDDDEESIETKFIKGLFGINNRDSHQLSRTRAAGGAAESEPPAGSGNQCAGELAGLAEGSGRSSSARSAPPRKKNQRRRSVEEDNRALTPAELNVVGPQGRRRQDSQLPPVRRTRKPTAGACCVPTNSAPRAVFSAACSRTPPSPKLRTFDREPTRADLTQPPPGYRTPSAAHPYGIYAEAGTGQAVRSA